MSKRHLPLLLDTLFALAWALWLGGLVALWVAELPPANFVLSARRMSGIVEWCGIVMVGIQFLLRRRYHSRRPLYIADGIRQLVTFGTLLLAETLRYSLLPVMESVLTTGKAGDYLHLRFLYTLMSGGQFVLLVAIMGLTVWLQQPRTVSSAANAPAPETGKGTT